MMNQVFHEYLDKFVVIYLDDIVVYSSSMEEHRDDLQKSMAELGWKREISAIQGFSKRASSLTELLKKDIQWGWTPECITAFDDLKQAMMDGAGHLGRQRTYTLLKDYFWPNMRDDVMQYTKICLICQQDKVEKAKIVELLDPLPVPTRPWERVSMDFITHLSKMSSSTGRSSFEIVSSRQLVLPHLVDHPYIGKDPQTHNFTKEWKQTTDIARVYLAKASRQIRSNAPLSFE
ncbi:reverse transcriptase [Cucumis melo var. makuwa]|uniref:Reverse transcriptase n=1 Tax=Cucumis melo var. makuwa TaxID=1194695 RepID=A0A5D3CCF6_CUCMM|nr:reverse transcriptase [Cucumis melo var. makuwa]TYK08982.1 reverse transcriptase [Cucumis melo var. makuwa]